MTKLIDAAIAGDTELVRRLLAEGAKPMKINWLGDTALVYAAANGHTEIVQALLAIDSSAAHINHVCALYNRRQGDGALCMNGGTNALMIAASWGHTDIVQALLTKDTSAEHINHTANNGSTALMIAASNGRTESVQALLAAGADANHTCNTGSTALMFAASNGRTESVQALLAKDPSVAHINHTAKNGSTTLMCAANYGHNDVITQLCQHKQQLFTQQLEEEFSDVTPLTKAQTDSLNAILRDMTKSQIRTHVLSQVKKERHQAIINADKTHIRWNWVATEPFRLLAQTCQAAQTHMAKLAEGSTPGMMIN